MLILLNKCSPLPPSKISTISKREKQQRKDWPWILTTVTFYIRSLLGMLVCPCNAGHPDHVCSQFGTCQPVLWSKQISRLNIPQNIPCPPSPFPLHYPILSLSSILHFMTHWNLPILFSRLTTLCSNFQTFLGMECTFLSCLFTYFIKHF